MHFIREPEAYYSTDLKVSTVFHGDAEVLLKKLPTDFFRCCVTSPPYWGLRDYNADGQIGAEDDPHDYIQRLVSTFEEVHRVLTADGTLWLNIGDSYTSGNREYYYAAANVRESNGRNRRTVWSIPTEPFLGTHFATFPPKLVEPCVLAGSRPDDWVLDPFFGSGTVGVVCEQQRRKYVGIELNPKYVQLAVKRIRNTERLLFSSDRDIAQ
jgi:DNA modification methylase